MAFHNILVVSDNEQVIDTFIDVLAKHPQLAQGRSVNFACSPLSSQLAGKKVQDNTVQSIDIKKDHQAIIDKYDLVISAHCKQLFPEALIKACRCINLHPGYNPYNRGWYPQVFSIINGLPLGATLHEIDTELDHGNIIDQQEVPLKASDTSKTAYKRVLAAEEVILERSIEAIFEDKYQASVPRQEGNLNLKKDFDALCEIRLDEQVTFQEAINRLRALTHAGFRNAYFHDPVSGKKIYISVNLEEEKPQ